MIPRLVPMGAGSLLITSEDFLNGYQAGHLAYMTEGRTIQLSEDRLTALIMDKLESMDDSEPYSVGYVVGWLVTFACKGRKAGQNDGR